RPVVALPVEDGADDEAVLGAVGQDLHANRSIEPADASDEANHEPFVDAQRISSWTGSPSLAAVTLSSVRSALATLPLRPMTLPISSSAAGSPMRVPPP